MILRKGTVFRVVPSDPKPAYVATLPKPEPQTWAEQSRPVVNDFARQTHLTRVQLAQALLDCGVVA